MKFRDRLFFFAFGIFLGIVLVSFLFKGKMRKGFADYFSGQDRIINFLISKTDIHKQIQEYLSLTDKDSVFIRDMIINTDVSIVSRDSCFEYLLTPTVPSCTEELLIKKCEEKVFLVNLKITDY